MEDATPTPSVQTRLGRGPANASEGSMETESAKRAARVSYLFHHHHNHHHYHHHHHHLHHCHHHRHHRCRRSHRHFFPSFTPPMPLTAPEGIEGKQMTLKTREKKLRIYFGAGYNFCLLNIKTGMEESGGILMDWCGNHIEKRYRAET